MEASIGAGTSMKALQLMRGPLGRVPSEARRRYRQTSPKEPTYEGLGILAHTSG